MENRLKGYVSKVKTNEIETFSLVLKLYGLTVLNEELSPREITVLRDYILNGYSKETKMGIRLTLGISAANLNTLNSNLQKKGFLEPHPRNQREKLLSKELLDLKEVFYKRKKKYFLISFEDAI